MHVQFADWFRIASIEPKDVDLKARWTSVETFAKDSSADDAIDCARLFFGLPLRDPAFLDRFRANFKSTDDNFSMLENNVELRVLAGATLVALFEYPDGWAEAAALLLTCGSFRELRPAPVGDIVRLAQEFLATRSASLRARHPDPPNADKLKDEFANKLEAARAALAAAVATNTVTDPLMNVFQAFSTGITSLVDWAQGQELQQAMRREESDVLWWLYAEDSRDLHVPFAQLKVPSATLIAAKEMADLTKTIPGPYAARAFLNKVVRCSLGGATKSTVTLAAAVGACPAEWRKSAATRPELNAVEDLCPTCLALRKAVEANGDKSWQQVFESVTGLKATQNIDPLDLAQQSYEEWLLVRAIKHVRDSR